MACLPETQPRGYWQSDTQKDEPIAQRDVEQPVPFQVVDELIDQSFKQDMYLFQDYVLCHG